MFIQRPGRMSVLCMFNLHCVSTGKGLPLGLTLEDQQDFHEFHLAYFSENQWAGFYIMATMGRYVSLFFSKYARI